MQTQDPNVDEVRAFNRFYAGRIGRLDAPLHGGPFTRTEVQILNEIAERREPTAADLGRALGLDAGYLSRSLRRFEADGLVTRWPSEADGRVNVISLTAEGHAALRPLDEAARAAVAAMLGTLSPGDAAEVVAAMRRIRRAFEGTA